MIIDNFNLIKPLLNFTSEDDCYYLQILQRKKENPELGSNSRVIKNYWIKSIDHLEKLYPEIKKLCEVFNARASIRLNRRSFRQLAFQSLKKISDQLLNEDFASVKNNYSKVSGIYHKDSDKTWIIDIDDTDSILLQDVINSINHDMIQPEYDKLVTVIPSKSGYHVICRPFNLQKWNILYPQYKELDIHKDNPTNLYIP